MRNATFKATTSLQIGTHAARYKPVEGVVTWINYQIGDVGINNGAEIVSMRTQGPDWLR